MVTKLFTGIALVIIGVAVFACCKIAGDSEEDRNGSE